MLKVLIPAVAVLGLVAFAARTQTPDAPVPHETVAMAWHVSHEGTMVKVAYGVANSDQLALMITCAPGDTAAVVYGDVQPTGARLTRASMSVQPVDPMSGGAMAETRLGLTDPGLRRLAGAGVMRVSGEAGEFDLRATSDERRAIADALAYCATGRA